jgi:hypothetical protein
MYPDVPNSNAGGLSAFTYGSEAGPSLQDPVRLAKIVEQMRASNTDLDVTRALVCGAGRIQQWIEGPEAAVSLLWDRIRLDPRHQVQWATAPTVVTARHFPGSPMKLAMTTANLARLDPCLIEDVVTLPDRLDDAGMCDWVDRENADARIAAFRKLDPAYRATACRLANSRALALAEVLTGADLLAARRYLDSILQQLGLPETASMVQKVLDHLQANWMAGLITAWQRQLAVTTLQSALRLQLDAAESPCTLGSVLVSVLPGTPDLCSAMVKVALLRRVGWSVRLLLPESVEEIRETAQYLQPDLIVLAGSYLAARSTELAMLSDLLPALAAHSAAPIILGGKLAETDPQLLLRLGAAAVCGALAWISTIAADLAPAPVPSDQQPSTGGARLADHALATFLAATRAREGRF